MILLRVVSWQGERPVEVEEYDIRTVKTVLKREGGALAHGL